MYKSMQNKKIFLILSCLLIFFAIVRQVVWKAKLGSDVKTIPIVRPIFLSNEEYNQVRDELLLIVDRKNPRIALETLSYKISTEDAVLRSCHALVHEIGHKAFDKYNDFGEAMKYRDEICNSGYLHGVIEAQFSKSPNVFEAVKTICSQYPHGKFLSWECYHGIGHGVMYYTSNDLPKSLVTCESYQSEFARVNCSNGVFMENFNTDQKLHPSKYLNRNNLFFPCQQQNRFNKGICYLYAPTYFLSLHKGDYLSALAWCRTAEALYQQTCAYGVGSQVIKENINNPKMAEKLCEDGERSMTTSCISGMVALYINHYGSLNEAKVLCGKLNKRNTKTCLGVVKSSEVLF